MIVSDEEYRRILSVMPVVCIDCLVVNEQGEYLLVKRQNEPLKGQYWVPGGRLHKNERLTDAVHRKMRQEIGVDVNIIKNVGFFEEFFPISREGADGGAHMISIIFKVTPRSYDIRLDDQSGEWGWFKELPPRFGQYGHLQRDETYGAPCTGEA